MSFAFPQRWHSWCESCLGRHGNKGYEILKQIESISKACLIQVTDSVLSNEEALSRMVAVVEGKERKLEARYFSTSCMARAHKTSTIQIASWNYGGSLRYHSSALRDFMYSENIDVARLFRSLQKMAKNRQDIPKDFSAVIISLLWKGKGDRQDLKTYRPLTLLNCDYNSCLAEMIQVLETTYHNPNHAIRHQAK